MLAPVVPWAGLSSLVFDSRWAQQLPSLEAKRRERESSERYQCETVSHFRFLVLIRLANMNIYIYSCCAVVQRTAGPDLLSKSSSLYGFNDNYLNL